MVTVYLWINAIAYAGLSLVCLARVRVTAASVGYGVLGSGGVSEFATVYGGLQLGLAAFFAICAMSPEMQRVGLLFAVCLYVPIALIRLFSVMLAGGTTVTWTLLALESSLMLVAAGLWLWHRPPIAG